MLAAFNRVVFVPKLYLIQPQSPHHGHSYCLPVTFASAPHIGQRILPVFGNGLGFWRLFRRFLLPTVQPHKKDCAEQRTTAIAAICSFVMLFLVSLVVLAACRDIECAVNLLEHHHSC